jgi:hypothetical protein
MAWQFRALTHQTPWSCALRAPAGLGAGTADQVPPLNRSMAGTGWPSG